MGTPLEYIKKEWEQIRGSPWHHIEIVVISFVAGMTIMAWHYSGVIDLDKATIDFQSKQLAALAANKDSNTKVAIAEVPKSAIQKMDNDKLKMRTVQMSNALRALLKSNDDGRAALQETLKGKPITTVEGMDARREVDRQETELWNDIKNDYKFTYSTNAKQYRDEMRARIKDYKPSGIELLAVDSMYDDVTNPLCLEMVAKDLKEMVDTLQ